MSFGPGDSGILEYKNEEEAKDYLENLGLKFKYGCNREGNPIRMSCVRLYMDFSISSCRCYKFFYFYLIFHRMPLSRALVCKL